MSLRRLLWSCPALLCAACVGTADSAVRQHGVMREVMREGMTQPRAAIGDYIASGWYAVGALAGLEGEILVDDGTAWIAQGSATNVQPALWQQATLLTAARVAAWRETSLPQAVDLSGLEDAIGTLVPGSLTAGAEPVPFVVQGEASALDMHVVRGACPHGDPDGPAPDRWSAAADHRVPVRLVGFFAPGREGVMTHHGTSLHVHALTAGTPRAMGHVDSLVLAGGARLMVPAGRR